MKINYKVSLLVVIFFIIFVQIPAAAKSGTSSFQTSVAQVIKLIPNDNKVIIKITSGPHKNRSITVSDFDNETENNSTTSNTPKQTGLRIGDEVMVSINENSDGTIKDAEIYDYVRYKYLYMLSLFFAALLIVLGGKKGIKSLATLLITGIAIIKIIIPFIMKGDSPVTITVIVCIGLIIINLLIISGYNKKTLSAIIGTSLGLLSSGLIVFTVGNIMRSTGINPDDAQVISSVFGAQGFDFHGLFFCIMLLSSLGAVMDIGISISSAMYEIENTNPNISNSTLIKSGLNVGKDIMGTMCNTLILAFAGGIIITIITLSPYNLPFIEIINQDIIASEILKALSGSIGLILTIPITALTFANVPTSLNKNKYRQPLNKS
ncbi:YibE/F family protein [Clostridium sp. WILCCON 0269]|uniref:YibE/F family protein n=1 Tax=Candidatus Clostridium eludens TaxID=3381663 RepID=A0ABW8SP16_9CLOT